MTLYILLIAVAALLIAGLILSTWDTRDESEKEKDKDVSDFFLNNPENQLAYKVWSEMVANHWMIEDCRRETFYDILNDKTEQKNPYAKFVKTIVQYEPAYACILESAKYDSSQYQALILKSRKYPLTPVIMEIEKNAEHDDKGIHYEPKFSRAASKIPTMKLHSNNEGFIIFSEVSVKSKRFKDRLFKVHKDDLEDFIMLWYDTPTK